VSLRWARLHASRRSTAPIAPMDLARASDILTKACTSVHHRSPLVRSRHERPHRALVHERRRRHRELGWPGLFMRVRARSSAAPPFNRAAAASALNEIAGDLASCRDKPEDPAGLGHATVTFSPRGTVDRVDVDLPPFAGTSVGGCVALKLRKAHIPAFSTAMKDDVVIVGKGFEVN